MSVLILSANLVGLEHKGSKNANKFFKFRLFSDTNTRMVTESAMAHGFNAKNNKSIGPPQLEI